MGLKMNTTMMNTLPMMTMVTYWNTMVMMHTGKMMNGMCNLHTMVPQQLTTCPAPMPSSTLRSSIGSMLPTPTASVS